MSDRIDHYVSNLQMIRDFDRVKLENDNLFANNVKLNILLLEKIAENAKLEEELPRKIFATLSHVLDQLNESEPKFTREELGKMIPAQVVWLIGKWYNNLSFTEKFSLSQLAEMFWEPSWKEHAEVYSERAKRARAGSMMGVHPGPAFFWPIVCL